MEDESPNTAPQPRSSSIVWIGILVVIAIPAGLVVVWTVVSAAMDANQARATPRVMPIATPIATSPLSDRYSQVGEHLDSRRSPGSVWADGSNWVDGVSHRMPTLPIAPSDRILDGMTCAQWEALNIAVFPHAPGYDTLNWYQRADADEIADKWNQNLADAIWGPHPNSLVRLERESFADSCGQRMR